MNIETQFNNRCVARGLSIMRIVLGMSGILPIEIENKTVIGVIDIVGKEFPNNEVYVWSGSDRFVNADTNVHYCGEEFPGIAKIDDTKYIIGFAYYTDDDNGHFVVGWPMVYNDKICLIIAVKENDNEQKATK